MLPRDTSNAAARHWVFHVWPKTGFRFDIGNAGAHRDRSHLKTISRFLPGKERGQPVEFWIIWIAGRNGRCGALRCRNVPTPIQDIRAGERNIEIVRREPCGLVDPIQRQVELPGARLHHREPPQKVGIVR